MPDEFRFGLTLNADELIDVSAFRALLERSGGRGSDLARTPLLPDPPVERLGATADLSSTSA